MIFSYASSPEKIPPTPIKGISPEDMLKSSANLFVEIENMGLPDKPPFSFLFLLLRLFLETVVFVAIRPSNLNLTDKNGFVNKSIITGILIEFMIGQLFHLFFMTNTMFLYSINLSNKPDGTGYIPNCINNTVYNSL